MKAKTTITKRVKLGKAQVLTDAQLDLLAVVTPDPDLIERAKAHASKYAPAGFVARLEAARAEEEENEG